MIPYISHRYFVTSMLPRIRKFIPGLEKAVYFYRHPDTGKLAAGYVDGQQVYEASDVAESGNSSYLLKERSKRLNWEWQAKDELKFDIESYDPHNINLFTPLMNRVLLIRMPGGMSNDRDLLYLYFSKNMTNFGLAESNSELEQQTKTAVGSLLCNILHELYRDENDRMEKYDQLVQLVKGVAMELEVMQKQMVLRASESKERIYRYCMQIVGRISDNLGQPITLHDSARVKLMEYSGELDELEGILSNAVFFADSLNGGLHEPLIIKEYHVRLNFRENKQQPATPLSVSKLNEATQYLDRMEAAATIVNSRGGKLTGQSLGEVMNPSVTPSAISQWLSLYSVQMTELLSTYPDKWLLIRMGFRPLKKKTVIRLKETNQGGLLMDS